MLSKDEIREWLLTNARNVDEKGKDFIDLNDLDFGMFHIDVQINNMRVGGNLEQRNQCVGGNLDQSNQYVMGNLLQDRQVVQGILAQGHQRVKKLYIKMLKKLVR